MFNPLDTVKLSTPLVVEALGQTNRFFTSQALNKRYDDCTAEECLRHYIINTPVGPTVYGYDVWPAQPAGDMGQIQAFQGDRHEGQVPTDGR